ncbi:hypothetical protein [Butyrivibrio proteoclasticus]|uniref:hypothetical protein n=1 Tax=Butyrivibrio proteoclasticus TaxID=43305 RepID=UPI00047D928A|nr:hypothetical protein [Butyrivibrio proteoclasticus]
MIKKDGTRWFSETPEGVYELSNDNAYYGVATEILELISSDELEGVKERISRVVELYKISNGLHCSSNIEPGKRCQWLSPIFEQLSIRGKEPHLCEVVARYAVREAWRIVRVEKSSDMLWELYAFYRDKIFPLVLYRELYKCEQYMRIVHAFYTEVGIKSPEKGEHIDIEEFFYGLERGRVKGWNTSFKVECDERLFRIHPVFHDERDVFLDLVHIPVQLAKYGLSFNTLPEEHRAIYKSTIECSEFAYGYDRIFDFHDAQQHFKHNDRDVRDFYKRADEMGWDGFCFVMASLIVSNSMRNRIARKCGFSSSDVAQYKDPTKNVFRSIGRGIQIAIASAVAIVGIAILVIVGGGIGSRFGWVAGVLADGAILGVIFNPMTRLIFWDSNSDYHVGVSSKGGYIFWK